MIAPEDNDKLVNKFDGSSDTKTLVAREFLDKVIHKEINLLSNTVDNFKNLFTALEISIS